MRGCVWPVTATLSINMNLTVVINISWVVHPSRLCKIELDYHADTSIETDDVHKIARIIDVTVDYNDPYILYPDVKSSNPCKEFAKSLGLLNIVLHEWSLCQIDVQIVGYQSCIFYSCHPSV